MSQEWKVATLEQCQRLKELGVVLDTEHYWEADEMLDDPAWPCLIYSWDAHDDYRYTKYAAPDVAELGKLLNVKIEGGIRVKDRSFWGDWTLVIHYNTGAKWNSRPIWHDHEIKEKTEAQARCAALIWLIENKHLKPNTIKIEEVDE